jgi:hypothetical protein
MKRFLFLLLLNSCFVLGFSQNTEPKVYITFDNSKFVQGDSIYLGYYSGYEKFDYVKEFYYNGQYDKGYRRVSGKLVDTKHKILDIYKDVNAIWDTSAYIIEVGETGFLKGYKLYININQAIKNGEIVLSQSPFKVANRKLEEFSDSIAFLFRVKQSSKPVGDFALEYLYRFKNKTYEKYKQDEFELDNQKQIATETLKTLVSKIIDTTTYFLDLELSFDNYDFSTLSFPVGGYGDYYKVIESTWAYHPETGLVFVNQKELNRVAVDKPIANSFIKRRKNKYGEIDRKVYARIYFKNVVIPSNAPARSSFSESNYRNFLFGAIYKIEFFDFKNRNYNYIGKINSNQ